MDVRKLGQNLDEKSHRKPNRTKTREYENQGLTVLNDCFAQATARRAADRAGIAVISPGGKGGGQRVARDKKCSYSMTKIMSPTFHVTFKQY